MKITYASFLALLLPVLILAIHPPPVAGEVYKVNGAEIEVTLVPDKDEIMVGEPFYLSFIISNHSDKDLNIIEGPDSGLDRPEKYYLTATRQDAKGISTVPRDDSETGLEGNGIFGPQEIPAKQEYVHKLLLPGRLRFDEPGVYSILCKKCRPEEYSLKRWNKDGTLIASDIQAKTTVTVVPFNKEKMGEVIKAIGATMLESHSDSDTAQYAEGSLALINDERVIPYFIKAIETKDYALKIGALWALKKFNTKLAFEGMKKGMATTADDFETREAGIGLAENIRVAAAYGLAASKSPEAREFLLSFQKDPYPGIRLIVLGELAKIKSERTLCMIQEMTKDDDKLVRGEAQRYLKELTAVPKKTP